MDPCALISTGTDTVGSRVNCRFGPVVRDRQPRTFPPPAWSLSSLPHLFFFNEKKKAVRLHSRGSALVFLLPKAPMWITCARGKRNIDGIRDTNRTRSCWQPGSEFTVRLETKSLRMYCSTSPPSKLCRCCCFLERKPLCCYHCRSARALS
jgi:hypothetical protein